MAPRPRAPNPSASKARPDRKTDVRGGGVMEGFLPLASSSGDAEVEVDASSRGSGDRRDAEPWGREGLAIEVDMERGL